MYRASQRMQLVSCREQPNHAHATRHTGRPSREPVHMAETVQHNCTAVVYAQQLVQRLMSFRCFSQKQTDMDLNPQPQKEENLPLQQLLQMQQCSRNSTKSTLHSPITASIVWTNKHAMHEIQLWVRVIESSTTPSPDPGLPRPPSSCC